MSAALQAVKKFRLHEIKGLQAHVARHGPLPTAQTAACVLPNPFVPRKNPNTGKWSPPKYSLRRQAELVKKAKASNTLHLLPPGPKLPRPELFQLASKPSTSQLVAKSSRMRGAAPKDAGQKEWEAEVSWDGTMAEKKVAGADVGTRLYAAKKRMFKGHKWERVKEKRENKRHMLMRDMEKRVANYKSYYHRRKPDPLKPPRGTKAPKLPF
ncbi:hypothetical protein HGRIS_011388 [Hohenbuehelia grisea]|uniref:Large ribosomal subunit protein mL59 domain-containing protein n=1 Tax=Hohenbuehelia grisea TaxID=104357 RepID=A0ABR3JWP1_9AGAR